MKFHFDEEEQEIIDMLHDYAVKEVAPRAAEIDEEERFPIEARMVLQKWYDGYSISRRVRRCWTELHDICCML